MALERSALSVPKVKKDIGIGLTLRFSSRPVPASERAETAGTSDFFPNVAGLDQSHDVSLQLCSAVSDRLWAISGSYGMFGGIENSEIVEIRESIKIGQKTAYGAIERARFVSGLPHPDRLGFAPPMTIIL
jgi:hypothetical protein